jgi:hypothetical protein
MAAGRETNRSTGTPAIRDTSLRTPTGASVYACHRMRMRASADTSASCTVPDTFSNPELHFFWGGGSFTNALKNMQGTRDGILRMSFSLRIGRGFKAFFSLSKALISWLPEHLILPDLGLSNASHVPNVDVSMRVATTDNHSCAAAQRDSSAGCHGSSCMLSRF